MGSNYAFFLPIMMLAFSVAFLLVWRWGSPPARYWSAGFGSAGVGFTTPVFETLVPFGGWPLFAHTMFAGAFFFYGQALLERWRAGWLFRSRLAIVGLSVLLCGLARGPMQNPALELGLSDLTCALLIGIPLIAGLSKSRPLADRVLLLAAALVTLDNLVRLGVLVATGDPGDFLASEYAFLMQAFASVLGLFLALTALAACILDIVASHRRDAELDPLTGTLNRRGFDRAIAEAPCGGLKGWVISCDIDRFKQVNDRFGHNIGDRVIASFAASIMKAVPSHAHVARFGGEEFIVYLPTGNAAEAATIAETIRAEFACDGAERVGLQHELTASFGLASAQADDLSIHDIMARADRALYEAKNGGRDRVCVWRLSGDAARRTSIDAAVPAAPSAALEATTR